MSSPKPHRYLGETSPTWIEKRPWLGRTAEILMYVFVLTAPVGAGFANNLDILAVYSAEMSTAAGLMFDDLVNVLYSLMFFVWALAVAVWLGSHLLRPHKPLRFEDMPFVLTAPSFLLYMVALGQGIEG